MNCSEKQQEAFVLLKEKLCEEPLFTMIRFRTTFHFGTDESGFAVGAILSINKTGTDTPIAYTSRSLNDWERKYDTYEKKSLAIFYCVKYFRPYLYGRKFTLITDHELLVWFQNSKDPCSRATRCKVKRAEYNFDVAHKAGKTNVNADALSRNLIDLEDTKNDDINNKNSIKINSILNVRKKYQKQFFHAVKKWIVILLEKILLRIISKKLKNV